MAPRVLLCVFVVLALLSSSSVLAGFSCTEQSSKPGYRCTRFQVTNYMSDALSLVSSKLEHGEWEQKPPSAIQPASTGAWEANGDCPLLDCFYGTSPSVVFNVAGADVTFYGENNLDKLLYGCNSVQTSPVPDNAEIKVENLSFSGCYCCHTAPCDCSAFINANHYEADVSVSPVATVTSIHPTYAPSAGAPVTVTGTGFVNSPHLACKFGTQVVAAAYLSPTSIVCSAPALLAPGTTTVPLVVSNLQTKWSSAMTFSYVATNAGAKLFLGSSMMNTVKDVLVPILQKALTNLHVGDFAGSDTVIGITIDYNLTNIVLDSIDFGTVTIATSPTGITLSTSNLQVATAMDWFYKDVGTIIHGSGSAVDKVSLDMSASFLIVRQGPSTGGDGIMQVSDVSVSASITDLDISTEPKSAEILIALLKGPLKSGFQSMLQKKLYGALSTTLNQALANVTMKVPVIPNVMGLDFSFMFDPTFTTDGVELYLRAGAVPLNSALSMPVVAPPLSQPADHSQSVQAMVSNYMANSVFYVLYKSKMLSGVVTPSMLPPSVPLKLNTTFFKSFLPALYNAFPNRAFDLVINVTSSPLLLITSTLPKNAGPGLTVNATTNVTFLITCPPLATACSPQPAFTLGLGVYASGSAFVKAGFVMPNSTTPAINVTGHMFDLEFNVSLASTHIGNFSMANLDMLLDMMLRAVALDMVNTKLEQGFLVPAQLGALAFSDTTLSFANSYVDIMTDASVANSVSQAPTPGLGHSKRRGRR